jgi:RNA polymerase sigma-70 factor (ECF subfamily)
MRNDRLARFETIALPHRDASYNLARWLLRHEQDAEDVVQEAYLRAFKFFDGFRGDDARAWLLKIVRNSCYTWLQQNRAQDFTTDFDEEIHSLDCDALGEPVANPETILIQEADHQMLKKALDDLPLEFREVMILREMESLSYKQIAAIVNVPTGTVMSRLARARKRLQNGLVDQSSGGP